MGQKKIQKRTTVKTFIKCINLNHFMPTRYRLTESDTKDLREKVREDDLQNADKK